MEIGVNNRNCYNFRPLSPVYVPVVCSTFSSATIIIWLLLIYALRYCDLALFGTSWTIKIIRYRSNGIKRLPPGPSSVYSVNYFMSPIKNWSSFPWKSISLLLHHGLYKYMGNNWGGEQNLLNNNSIAIGSNIRLRDVDKDQVVLNDIEMATDPPAPVHRFRREFGSAYATEDYLCPSSFK